MKTFRRCAIIAVVILAVAATMVGSFAIYSAETESEGTITAREFNINSTFQEDITVSLWLGETRYWEFSAENSKNGHVAMNNITLDMVATLKGVDGKHLVGLEVTIEESIKTQAGSRWQTSTVGAWASLDNPNENSYLSAKSSTLFTGGVSQKKQFRLVFRLPNTADNSSSNGFNDPTANLGGKKTAIDLSLSFRDAV